jgi:hypothetical protein
MRMDVDGLSTLFGIVYTEIITILQSIHAKSFDIQATSSASAQFQKNNKNASNFGDNGQDDFFKPIRFELDLHNLSFSSQGQNSSQSPTSQSVETNNVLLPTHHNNVRTNELLYGEIIKIGPENNKLIGFNFGDDNNNNKNKKLSSKNLILQDENSLSKNSLDKEVSDIVSPLPNNLNSSNQDKTQAALTPGDKPIPQSTSFFDKLKFTRNRTESKINIIDINTAVTQAKQQSKTTMSQGNGSDMYINKTYLQLLLECCKVLDFSILVIPDTFYHYKWMFIGLDWTSMASMLTHIPSYPHIHDFCANPDLTTQLYSELYQLDPSKPAQYRQPISESSGGKRISNSSADKAVLSFHPHLQSLWNDRLFINNVFYQKHPSLNTMLIGNDTNGADISLAGRDITHGNGYDGSLGVGSVNKKYLPLFDIYSNSKITNSYNNTTTSLGHTTLLQPLPFSHTSALFNRPIIYYHKISNLRDLSPFFTAFLHLFYGDSTPSTLFNVNYTSTFAMDMLEANSSLGGVFGNGQNQSNAGSLRNSMISNASRLSHAVEYTNLAGQSTMINVPIDQGFNRQQNGLGSDGSGNGNGNGNMASNSQVPPILQRMAQTTGYNNLNNYQNSLLSLSTVTPFPLSLQSDEVGSTQYWSNIDHNNSANKGVLLPDHVNTLSTLFNSPEQQPSALFTRPHLGTKGAAKSAAGSSRYDAQFLNIALLQDFIEDIDHIS